MKEILTQRSTRRGFLKGVGEVGRAVGVTYGAARLGLNPLPARAQEAVVASSVRLSPEALAAVFTQEVDIYKSKISQALGSPVPEPYSSIFPDQQNNEDSLLAYDGILFKQDPEGKVTVAHALTRLDAVRPLKGITDQDLVEGKLGGHIIPTLAEGALPVSQPIVEVVTKLGEVINSPLLRVSGATIGKTSNTVVYRLGDDFGDYFTLTNNPDTNQLRLGNIAVPLTKAGLIPETAILPRPERITGGGEIQQPLSQVIEGPRKILATEINPEAPLNVGPTPTFNQLEEHLFSQGVNRLETKYNDFPELPEPGNGVGWGSICPTNDDPRCETPFIYFKRQINPDRKAVIIELKLAQEKLPSLSPQDIDYLDRALQGSVADYVALMKYGSRMALISDPKLKLEAEQTLLKPLKEIKGLQFLFK